MTQEMITNNLLTQSEIEYTLDTLPELSLQQSLMLNHILEGNSYTEAYRKAGYTATEHAHTAAWNLVIRNPLKAHMDFFMRELGKRCTVDYKLHLLNRIAEQCINPDNVIKNGDTAIKAIDVMAKIQGHYAPANINVQSITTTIEDIRNARKEYVKDK